MSNEFENLKEKTNRLEELFKETDTILKAAKVRIELIEEHNERLETELAKALEIAKVTELVVKEPITKLVATVSKQQDEMEQAQNLCIAAKVEQNQIVLKITSIFLKSLPKMYKE